jgi:hypothetical protein
VHKILGHWLLLPSNLGDGDYKLKVLDELAASDCLWKQRMSIVCSWKTSQMGDPSWCLRYSEIHLHHPHDLMHKAVGWMLREMGKRCSMDLLRDFLRQHAHEMPRTMLRYAIEKMPEQERKEWMAVDVRSQKEDGFATPHSALQRRCTKAQISPFAGIPVSDFGDIILHDAKQCDEAMYYLLHQRMNHQLRERYDAYQHQLYDSYEDVIEDFFLYLREGKGNRFPYQALKRIKSKDAFETWVMNTFRNYLNNRAKEENGSLLVSFSEHESNELNESFGDEQKQQIASQLIAYAHQVFYPRGRFIFLRSLLTMLNKQKALPNAEVAKTLGMTDISYRVIAHRMKCNLTKFRQRLMQGESLRLDEQHQQMAQHIYDDFDKLYPTLLSYYTQTINTLKCSEDIKRLRQQHYEATGMMAHEPEFDSPGRTTVKAFWNKLNRMLI